MVLSSPAVAATAPALGPAVVAVHVAHQLSELLVMGLTLTEVGMQFGARQICLQAAAEHCTLLKTTPTHIHERTAHQRALGQF